MRADAVDRPTLVIDVTAEQPAAPLREQRPAGRDEVVEVGDVVGCDRLADRVGDVGRRARAVGPRPPSGDPVVVVLTAYALFTIARLLLSYRRRLPWPLLVASIVVDTALLMSAGPPLLTC